MERAKSVGECIDVAMDRFATDAVLKAPALEISHDMFDNVSFTKKDVFPHDANLGTEEPIFSQRQVRRLMQIVASNCGEAMAIGLATANNETNRVILGGGEPRLAHASSLWNSGQA